MSKNIWVGDYSDYIIPDDLYSKTKFTKTGYPDKRCKGFNKFMKWVKKVESNFRNTLEKSL